MISALIVSGTVLFSAALIISAVEQARKRICDHLNTLHQDYLEHRRFIRGEGWDDNF